MKNKITIIITLALTLGIMGCGKTEVLPSLTINESLYQYMDITYQEFQNLTGSEAEFYHGTRYIAPTLETDVYAIFFGNYDDKLAADVIEENTECIRLQGKLGALVSGLEKELTVEEFIGSWGIGENVSVDYSYEEGSGTAYFVGKNYVAIRFAQKGKNFENVTWLDISLDYSEKIGPDSDAWLSRETFEESIETVEQEVSEEMTISEIIDILLRSDFSDFWSSDTELFEQAYEMKILCST